mmetsp:Transcript_36366/g.93764  ORF Transcript_36366/g.93764 Transcript_36366/m.93764 type:complete len:242 (-) Transcript_36366:105-830(-)
MYTQLGSCARSSASLTSCGCSSHSSWSCAKWSKGTDFQQLVSTTKTTHTSRSTSSTFEIDTSRKTLFDFDHHLQLAPSLTQLGRSSRDIGFTSLSTSSTLRGTQPFFLVVTPSPSRRQHQTQSAFSASRIITRSLAAMLSSVSPPATTSHTAVAHEPAATCALSCWLTACVMLPSSPVSHAANSTHCVIHSMEKSLPHSSCIACWRTISSSFEELTTWSSACRTRRCHLEASMASDRLSFR